jgi:hypothetical protein
MLLLYIFIISGYLCIFHRFKSIWVVMFDISLLFFAHNVLFLPHEIIILNIGQWFKYFSITSFPNWINGGLFYFLILISSILTISNCICNIVKQYKFTREL